MNIQSYTALHYGLDYLPYALRSIYNHVDRLNIIYTPVPSHGTSTNATPPDSRASLMRAAFDYDPAQKINWYDVDWIRQEGQQRDAALQICQNAGADLVLVIDCDEVWPEKTLRAALDYAWKVNSARNWLINFSHFWRSFDYVCKDNNWPVRIIDLRHSEGVGYIPQELGDIYHFGYAVRDEILRYKISIHGHKAEFRLGWYEDKWNVWPPVPDCHPTNADNWWVPEKFDKTKLPEIMKSHPFYNLEKVE